MAKDCEFKITYDLTQPKNTLEVTIFNDPTNPFDLKVECETGNNMAFGLLMNTPMEAYKTIGMQWTINKSLQPYSVKMEGNLNGQTATAQGMHISTSLSLF